MNGTVTQCYTPCPSLSSLQPPSGAVVEGYIVEVLLPNRTLVQAVNVSAPSVSFSALVRGSSYLFEVAAYNSGGVGPMASLMYTIPPGT